MEKTKQVKVPLRIWILRGWLIILALMEIGFGLFPFWGSVSWAGDYLFAAFILLFISFIGVISLVSGIFLFMGYKWAWYSGFIMLILIAFISGQDIAVWLSNGGGVSSIFQHTFGYQTDSADQLLGTLVMVPLIGTLIWMFLDRKKLTQR